MKKLAPTSSHERHQKYFDAFHVSPTAEDSKYLNYITQYISDPNISHLNDDDLDFFRQLLFDSPKGKVHIRYYDWIVNKWIQFAFPQSIIMLSKYADYLGQLSELFLKDFFSHLLKLSNKMVLVNLFQALSPTNRVHFVNWADHNSEVVKLIPKVKFYLLFS